MCKKEKEKEIEEIIITNQNRIKKYFTRYNFSILNIILKINKKIFLVSVD